MFPKAHLTLHSRKSGSKWVITPSWLSGSLRYFPYNFSRYSYRLILIYSASVRPIPFLSFIVPIVAWNSPLLSLMSLMKPLSFPILLFSSVSLHYHLKKAFFSLFALLWNSAFWWVYLSFSPCLLLLFYSELFVKPSYHVQCYESPSIVLRALRLSDLIYWICLSLPLHNCKGFNLGHTEWSSGFLYFLQFKAEFCNKEFMI